MQGLHLPVLFLFNSPQMKLLHTHLAHLAPVFSFRPTSAIPPFAVSLITSRRTSEHSESFRASSSQQSGSDLHGRKHKCSATCTARYHVHISSPISQIPFAKKQLVQVPALQPCASDPEECQVALARPMEGKLNGIVTSVTSHLTHNSKAVETLD